MVVIGAASGGLGRPEDGETGGRKPGRGRGAGEVAFIPSEGPRSTTLGNHRGAGRAPGVTTRRYTSFGPPPGCAGRTTPARPVLKIRHIGHGPFLSARRPRPVLGSVSTPCESTGQGRRTPPLAVAAGLNLGPVGRRARVGCPPCPFLCRRRRLEPRPRETPRTIAAPGPPLAVAARLKPRPVGRRARPGRSARRFLCRRRPLEPSPRETPCSPGPPASSLRGGRRRPAGRGRSAGSEGGAGP